MLIRTNYIHETLRAGSGTILDGDQQRRFFSSSSDDSLLQFFFFFFKDNQYIMLDTMAQSCGNLSQQIARTFKRYDFILNCTYILIYAAGAKSSWSWRFTVIPRCRLVMYCIGNLIKFVSSTNSKHATNIGEMLKKVLLTWYLGGKLVIAITFEILNEFSIYKDVDSIS